MKEKIDYFVHVVGILAQDEGGCEGVSNVKLTDASFYLNYIYCGVTACTE